MKRIFRPLLAIALLTVLLTGCTFNYMKKDLSRYVTLAREDYLGLVLSVPPVQPVTEQDIERAINALLVEDKAAVNGGIKEYQKPLGLGDTANIYYVGSYVNDLGLTVQFAGGSTMTSSSASSLVIGSGSFIPGFEEGLMGVMPASTYLELDREGTVHADDVIYLDLTYRYEKTPYNYVTGTISGVRLDLADPGAFGADIAKAMVGLSVGVPFSFGEDDPNAFHIDFNRDGIAEELALSGKVVAISNEKTVSVTATFPADYEEESLAGREATFLVVVESMVDYDVPEFGEEWIEDSYPDFETEGDLLTGFRDFIRESLESDREEAYKNALEDAIWEHMIEHAEVHEYPKSEVKAYYKMFYEQLEADYASFRQYAYEQYGDYLVYSLDEFALTYYYDLPDEYKDDWKGYLTYTAEQNVRDKLLFYTIVRQEGYTLSEEEYDRRIEEYLESYALLNGTTVDAAREQIGEEDLRETALYAYVMEQLRASATVN